MLAIEMVCHCCVRQQAKALKRRRLKIDGVQASWYKRGAERDKIINPCPDIRL